MIIEPTPNAETYFLDSEPTSANPALGRKVDAIRSVLSVTQIRGIGEERRLRQRELNLRDTSDRIRVMFARFLFERGLNDLDLPSDHFLRAGATGIYDAILGVTSEPRKVTK